VTNACVVGWPVAHSRSPLIHGYWLRAYGIEGRYGKEAVPPDAFAPFITALRERGYSGCNVTLPHKGAAAKACGWLTEPARRLGSANTLWFDGETLCGDTTDGAGFLAALDEEAPGWDAGNALVLGAGGAAAPIVDALSTRVDRVIVANRTRDKAEALALRTGCDVADLGAVDALLPEVHLLVNATSAELAGGGALPIDVARLPAKAVMNDIVYVPAVTPLLARAAARGLRTVGGLGMLLHQAAPGFARWFGVTPTVSAELRRLVEADIAGAAARSGGTS
jgi:shikimate dehydrogenase